MKIQRNGESQESNTITGPRVTLPHTLHHATNETMTTYTSDPVLNSPHRRPKMMKKSSSPDRLGDASPTEESPLSKMRDSIDTACTFYTARDSTCLSSEGDEEYLDTIEDPESDVEEEYDAETAHQQWKHQFEVRWKIHILQQKRSGVQLRIDQQRRHASRECNDLIIREGGFLKTGNRRNRMDLMLQALRVVFSLTNVLRPFAAFGTLYAKSYF
ncbi:hypothetical protein PROFUN_09672 [Planoprotostelium fungivorum]|uniref:Uncharacterized protein n=1 Tax=Planoprotostelium fungivorum TaxID=1890364 RepID=A0A2P6NGI6_9EUKA|nr:hypothetical protein PROFUN_09672 [Planoprotostelium fungivorum]